MCKQFSFLRIGGTVVLNATYLLQMLGISKRFGEIVALEDVSLRLGYGEVLGLVGDNGAGKSTLMKILAGVFPPSGGRIIFGGKEVRFAHPGEARALGIEMIYQDLALAENMDVVENIFLGEEIERKIAGGLVKVIDRERMKSEAQNILERLRIDIKSVEAKVENLSGGQRQSVAIARALRSDAKLIVMDEPTAALGISEVERLLNLIRELKRRGISVIMVSHRLEDIFEVGDRVMVLRHGKCVGDKKLSETSMQELRRLMIGDLVSSA